MMREEKRNLAPKGMGYKVCLAVLFILCFFLLSGFTYQEDKQRIYDNGNLLTEAEKTELEELFQEYSLKDEVDYVFLTTETTFGMESREYAKQFYKEKGFGYNQKNGDGNLLYIDMENRRVEIIDRGSCIDSIRDEEIENILDDVEDALRDEEYVQAAQIYVKEMHSAMVTDNGGHSMIRYFIYGILALIVAGIITASMVSGHKSHITVDAHTYSKKIRVNPKTKQDRFLRTVTTARPKEREKSHGSGGSRDRDGFGGGGRGF
jgi:uncharacterized membrane protein YgcG